MARTVGNDISKNPAPGQDKLVIGLRGLPDLGSNVGANKRLSLNNSRSRWGNRMRVICYCVHMCRTIFPGNFFSDISGQSENSGPYLAMPKEGRADFWWGYVL